MPTEIRCNLAMTTIRPFDTVTCGECGHEFVNRKRAGVRPYCPRCFSPHLAPDEA